MRRFLARLASLFRGRSAEREMTREIESHLALLQEDFERRGLSPEEAALAARRAYGGVEQAKELHRDTRSFVWIEQLLKDVRYGWRSLLRNPGFTLVAAIALALGIGANTTIFGIYNAAALKQLPVADASRVVRVKRWFQHKRGDSQYTFAYSEYQYLRDHNSVFSGVVASYNGADGEGIPVLAWIAGAAAQEHLDGCTVSANYFAELGVKARIGRTFRPDEDRLPGANPVVVLNYRQWQRRFHGDTNVIGQTIKLNGLRYTIVGVTPQAFTGTDATGTEPGFWAPLSMIEQLEPASGAGSRDGGRDSKHGGAGSNPGPREFQLLARMKNGVARANAQAETDLLIRQYLSGYHESERTTAVTLQRTSYFSDSDQFSVIQAPAAALSIVVTLVLVVACANVANMLLARGAARQREIGIRLALGASRSRVVRQLLTESILLALLGGAAGIPLSAWTGRLLWLALINIFQGFHFHLIELDVSPDAHTFLYGLAVSILAGVLFGLPPALRFTRPDLNSAIKEEGPVFGARLSRSRLRGLLLGMQVAVSVLLLMTSGVLMSNLVRSNVSDLGFEADNAYLVMTDGDSVGINKRLRERLAMLPEVSSTSIGDVPLLGNWFSCPMAAGKWNRQTLASHESDAYFETMGIRLLRGRSFTRQEAERRAPMAVISESTARRCWPNEDPIGKHLSLDPESKNKFTDFEVIGVAQDVHHTDIAEADPLHVYLPTDGSPGSYKGGLAFRIRGNRDKALAAVQSAVESVDRTLLPGLNLVSVAEGPVAVQRGLNRMAATVAGAFTLLALTLAGVGVYGVMAFLVSQRTREIGIRMALGATSHVVLRSVAIQGLRPVFIGMLAGFAGAAWLDGLDQSTDLIPNTLVQRLFGDPAVYGEVALVVAIAVLASVIPARRALRVDPMVALRHE